MKKHSLIQILGYEKNRFYMDLPLNRIRLEKSKPIFPFQIADDSGQLARVIKGTIRYDKDTLIKKVQLLVQRDNYRFEYSDINPVTNSVIDRQWQQSFRTCENNSVVYFADLKDNKNNYQMFKALFYCQKTGRFFHPLCPLCASDLQLCQDDDLLKKNALPSYSNSLTRYLYCPSCIRKTDKAAFYCYEKKPREPGYVKDRFDLINDYKSIPVNPDTFFPCHDCRDRMDCYMTGDKACHRISFFSFYPFHMLCVKNFDMPLEIFLPLLSGAEKKEMKLLTDLNLNVDIIKKLDPYELKKRFFFHDNFRFFLEVLYLKLSLLRETARAFYIISTPCGGDKCQLSFKKIWIKLSDNRTVFPYLWNFSVGILDIPEKIDIFDDLFQGSLFANSFGVLWLYVLLSNKNQRSSEILSNTRSVLKTLKNSNISDPSFFSLINENPVFQPSQVFWNDPGFKVPADHLDLWNKTIESAFFLFQNKNQSEHHSIIEKIISEIDCTMETLKQRMFSAHYGEALPESSEPKPSSPRQENQARPFAPEIHGILTRIKKAWRQDSSDFDHDIIETVSMSTPEEEINRMFEDKSVSHVKKSNDSDNYLEIEKDQMSEKPAQSSEEQILGPDFEKTVIITPDSLSETTQMNQSALKQKSPSNTSPVTGESLSDNFHGKTANSNPDIEKTVILSPGKNKIDQTSPGSDTEETRIIPPQNYENKDKGVSK